MKKGFAVGVAVAIALSACSSNQEEIESAITVHLRDPDSAQFQKVILNKKGDRACAVWNARNSFGGYGDWQMTGLEKGARGWQITETKVRADRCTEKSFRIRDDFEAAQEGLQKAIER